MLITTANTSQRLGCFNRCTSKDDIYWQQQQHNNNSITSSSNAQQRNKHSPEPPWRAFQVCVA